MSSVLPIQATVAVRAGSDSAGEAKTPEPLSLASAQQTVTSSLIINPTLRLDAGLGLVVIEFRNNSGNVTTSIPSQRQIEAYQRWTQTHSGPDPGGGADGSTTSAPVPPVVATEPPVPSHTGLPGEGGDNGSKSH